MFKYILLLILIIISVVFFAPKPQLSYKIQIIKKENESFVGCFGPNCKPGCSNNLFIAEDSSLSFKCQEKLDRFTDKYFYIFAANKTYFVCPENNFAKSKCYECLECDNKIEQLKKLNRPD